MFTKRQRTLLSSPTAPNASVCTPCATTRRAIVLHASAPGFLLRFFDTFCSSRTYIVIVMCASTTLYVCVCMYILYMCFFSSFPDVFAARSVSRGIHATRRYRVASCTYTKCILSALLNCPVYLQYT